MADISLAKPIAKDPAKGLGALFAMLWRDKLAFISALILAIIVICAIVGPWLLGDIATSQNLRGRNSPPFDLSRGWIFVLGGDSLGRPMLARLIVAAQSTIWSRRGRWLPH